MNSSPSFRRVVGLGALIAHLGTLTIPWVSMAAPPSPNADNWSPPAVVRSKLARPNLPDPVSPPDMTVELPDAPTADRLQAHRGLGVPLTSRGNVDPGERERSGLAQALNRYSLSAGQPTHKRLPHLIDYLAQHPETPYAGSLWSEVAVRADASGDFKSAVAASRAAWASAKSVNPAGDDFATIEVAEKALARLVNLYARTGQKDALTALLAESASRPAHQESYAALAAGRQALKWWETDPVSAAACGVIAYDAVANRVGAPNLSKYPGQRGDNWGDSIEQQAARRKDEAELVQHGLSAARLLERISGVGGHFKLVKRQEGAEIPVPSVAHLIFGPGTGHYSALVGKNEGRTRITDTHLRFVGWMADEVLNSQVSGYFIVPDNQELPSGFADATAEEASSVFGRESCPGAREPDDEPPCESCGCKGMATYSISKFLPGVRIFDQPVTYTPAYGPIVDFTVSYRQVQFGLDPILDNPSALTNLGSSWSHPFLSYVRSEEGLTLPTQADLRVVSSSGAIKKYVWNPGTSTWATRNSSDPKLTQVTISSGGFGYRLTDADGSFTEFGKPDAATPYRYLPTRKVNAQGQAITLLYSGFRLAQIVDATGKITSFGYSPTNSQDNRIYSITDPYSRTASFTYHPSPSGRLASITDTIGITSSFTYQSTSGDISSLTTPDGTTHFEMTGTPMPDYQSNWSVKVTDPHQDVEVIESFYESALADSLRDELVNHAPPASITVGSTATTFFTADTENEADHFHVSFHWTKKYWGEYQKALRAAPQGQVVDPHVYAEATLWLMNESAYGSSSVSVPFATRKPSSAMLWYNYPGQTATTAYAAGTDNQPSRTARQIENTAGVNTWVMTQQAYNALGLPTVHTDELGHKTQNIYFTTAYVNNATWGTTVINRDVQYEQVWSGAAWVTTRTYGKYANGVPGTITDASGKITTFVHNAQQQVTEQWVSKSTNIEKTRYTYDADGQGTPDGQPGYLMKVERTTNAAATTWATVETYTYDTFGRKATETDASAYTRSIDYDDFDRVSLITYPDGTTEQFSYLRGLGATTTNGLDLTAQKDRAGRWTRFVYDEVRRLVMTITPDNLTTKQDWCKCGKLWKLTDKAGRVTEWKRDILGRVYEKLMPDGSTKTTYTYQPRSGRLATMTRPNQQGTGTPTVTYSYNLNGTLQKQDFIGTDCDASYTYDVYDRVTSVVDGLGTHSYTYAVWTAGTAGAGQVAVYNSPLANATCAYGYDWQDRITTQILRNDAATPLTLRTQTTTWDPLGRTNTIVNALGTFTFGYTSNLSRPDSLTAPNSVVTSYGYYSNSATGARAQRLESITHSRTGVQYSKHSFDYDPAGRITAWNQEASGLASVGHAYDYNLSDEVTADVKTDTATSNVLANDVWAYDNAGNWMSKGTTAAMSTRSHNALNQLTSIGGAGSTVVAGKLNEIADVTVNTQPAPVLSDPASGGYRFSKKVDIAEGTNTITVQAVDKDNPPNTTTQNYQLNVGGLSRSFTYDANGNMLSDGERVFTWDAKNRLKTVTKAGVTYRWDYDYQDRRVKEYSYPAGGSVPAFPGKLFNWDGTDLIQERSCTTSAIYTAGGSVTRTHLFGGFMEGYISQTTVAKYQVLTDHLGHTRDIIANNAVAGTIGTLVARYDYTTFQGPVKLSGTVDASLLIASAGYHHAGAGIELFMYRAFDAELGRWLSCDPLEELVGTNLYAYTLNRPCQYFDPNGLDSTDIYVPDKHKHGGEHIDRYTKQGKNVGRYRIDGSGVEHKKKVPPPIPGSDWTKFLRAVDKLKKMKSLLSPWGLLWQTIEDEMDRCVNGDRYEPIL